MPIFKNTARRVVFAMVDSVGAGVAGTPTLKVSKDGASFASLAGSPSPVSVGSGAGGEWYVDIAAGDLNCDVAYFEATLTGAIPVRIAIYPEADYTSTKAGYIDAAVSSRSTLTAAQVRTELSTELGRIDAAVSSRSSHSAADVWSSPARTLTSFGTLVADTAAAVWASVSRTLTDISDSAGVTTLLSRLTATRAGYLDSIPAIKAKTDTIGSSAILVNTPVSIDGSVTIVQGRTYKTLNGGQQITVSISGIDLTGATVAVRDASGTSLATASVTDPGGTSQSITFELDDSKTSLMAVGATRWEIVATYSGEPVHVGWLSIVVEPAP